MDSVDAPTIAHREAPVVLSPSLSPSELEHNGGRIPETGPAPSEVSSPTESGSQPSRSEEDDDSPDARGTNLLGYLHHLPKNHRHQREMGRSDNATTLTEMDSPFYDLSEGQKLAIVFNQEHFASDLPSRKGTESDCQRILDTFEKIGFLVKIYDNLPHYQIDKVIQSLQSHQEPELACLLIIILSHGEENGVLHSYDKPYRLDKTVIKEILPSKCPALKGKPKLIFVQACQGKEVDPGTEVRVRSRHTSTDSSNSNNYRIPHYSDLLMVQAAYHGHYSFRSQSGSWLIQGLCNAIDQSREDESFHNILIKVKRFVSLYRESNVPTEEMLDRKRQIPLVQDTLIRELYLKGYRPPDPEPILPIQTLPVPVLTSQIEASPSDLVQPVPFLSGSLGKKKTGCCLQ